MRAAVRVRRNPQVCLNSSRLPNNCHSRAHPPFGSASTFSNLRCLASAIAKQATEFASIRPVPWARIQVDELRAPAPGQAEARSARRKLSRIAPDFASAAPFRAESVPKPKPGLRHVREESIRGCAPRRAFRGLARGPLRSAAGLTDWSWPPTRVSTRRSGPAGADFGTLRLAVRLQGRPALRQRGRVARVAPFPARAGRCGAAAHAGRAQGANSDSSK